MCNELNMILIFMLIANTFELVIKDGIESARSLNKEKVFNIKL
jgi:hypothetical protein